MNRLRLLLVMGAIVPAASASSTFTITPSFDSSITSNGSAAAIEGSINSAISAIGSLYASPTASPLNITVTFTYDPAGANYLAQTTETFYGTTYSTWEAALLADSTANPSNTTLATAVANLSSGNDANGAKSIVLTGAIVAALLGQPASDSDAVININSQQPFDFTQSPSNTQFDLTGTLEHELDEVLGGGGAGSAADCLCSLIADLDPFRYAAPGTPSFSASGSATSYFSIDGGTTNIVGFNQQSSGDFGDFDPPCGTGSGTEELIQNAFTCAGVDEAYTTGSPEFTMMEAIGWDPTASDLSAPEPADFGLVGIGLAVLGFARRLKK